jgi:hypothetical protein
VLIVVAVVVLAFIVSIAVVLAAKKRERIGLRERLGIREKREKNKSIVRVLKKITKMIIYPLKQVLVMNLKSLTKGLH